MGIKTRQQNKNKDKQQIMAIKITRRDVMSGELVPFGEWYKVKVTKMDVGQAKKDQSTNYIYTLKFLDEDYKDCSINPIYVNEKGVFGNSLLFLKACGADTESVKNKVVEESVFDENAPVNQVIMAKIGPNEYNGKTTNQAIDFMPISN